METALPEARELALLLHGSIARSCPSPQATAHLHCSAELVGSLAVIERGSRHDALPLARHLATRLWHDSRTCPHRALCLVDHLSCRLLGLLEQETAWPLTANAD